MTDAPTTEEKIDKALALHKRLQGLTDSTPSSAWSNPRTSEDHPLNISDRLVTELRELATVPTLMDVIYYYEKKLVKAEAETIRMAIVRAAVKEAELERQNG